MIRIKVLKQKKKSFQWIAVSFWHFGGFTGLNVDITDHRVHTNGPLSYVIHPSISIIIALNVGCPCNLTWSIWTLSRRIQKPEYCHSCRENKRHSDPGTDDDSAKYVWEKLGPRVVLLFPYHQNSVPGWGVVLAGMNAMVPSPLQNIQHWLNRHIELRHPCHLQLSVLVLYKGHVFPWL